MRGLTLWLNRFCLYWSQIWNLHHLNLSLISQNFVGRSGRIYGTIVKVINFTLSTLLLAMLHTTKARPIMTQYSRLVSCYAFSALTLLVGWQEGNLACKNWVVGFWHRYLSGWGADLHMAKVMPLPLTISCSSKSRLVLPSCWPTVLSVEPMVQYVVCLSVCRLSVTFCIVAKRCVLTKKCLK